MKKGTPKALPKDNPSEIFEISTADVKQAISLLKCNKSPDPFGIVAEHIKHADSDKLYI